MTDYERFSAILSYDPQTGCLTWRKRRRRVDAGDVAGTRHSSGRLHFMTGGKVYSCHRVAWLLHYGEWPAGEIDHINCDGSDNRISNLRIATRSQNNANRAWKRKSGLPKGVRRAGNKFVAQITVCRETKRLGCFSTPEEAHAAYVVAAQEAFGEFARAA